AGLTAMWLLATYPGITYWIGLPYSYVWIVPGSLLLTMLLWKLSRTTPHRDTLFISLAIGFCFWGYDLLPFFGIAALLILAWRRRFLQMLVALLGMTIPMVVLFAVLKVVFRLPLLNSNSGVYWVVLKSFASPVDYGAWWKLIAAAPSIFVDNFFASNFLFLPLLFVLLAGVSYLKTRSISFNTPEREILLATLLVFLVNNLAPPYAGWQMRGIWIARIYQPVFVAFVL